MKTLHLVIFIFAVIGFFGCSEFESEKLYSDTEINIYLVKNGQLNNYPDDVDLNSVQLEKSPWLEHSEIAIYDWSSQIFYLNVEKSKSNLERQHFMVTSNEKPLFYGIFFPINMSSIPQVPSIIAHDDLFYPTDVLGLGGYGFQETIDLLEDEIGFREELENAGLLHEGISVELTGIKRLSSNSLEYTFKVTNLDSEKLYLLDPNKMGSLRYHYYTNGVYLNDGETNYFAQDMSVISSERIQSKWYYKLSPGKSMIRTVKLDGFPAVPTGNVEATFIYSGADIKAGEWKKRDGRVWLGKKMVVNNLLIH